MNETSAATSEQTLIQNIFGAVTSKRVTYYRNKSWFSGGSREDIPLQHVTSVRVDITRSLIAGVLLLLIGLGMVAADGVGIKILGLGALGIGVLMLWGSPAVTVNTAGQDLNAMKGLPWQRDEANQFVEALRKQLFG